MLKGIYEKVQDNSPHLSPVTWIGVVNPGTQNSSEEFKVVIDSSAPMTAIPESVIENLGAMPYSVIRLRSPLDNNIITTRLYIVDIRYGDHNINLIKVFTIPKDYGLIGRDILNRHKVTLNGPKGTWSLE